MGTLLVCVGGAAALVLAYAMGKANEQRNAQEKIEKYKKAMWAAWSDPRVLAEMSLRLKEVAEGETFQAVVEEKAQTSPTS